jgi:predicted membrane protein
VRALGLFGGVRLDLRQAEVTADEIWVAVDAVCGAVEVVVPHGVSLDISGLAMFGAQHADAGEERPPRGAPTVHLKARVAFGSLTVRRG